LIFGLDGVPPEFLFDRMLPEMPNIRRLMSGGVRAPLRTTDPPISLPAWPVMFSGVDPGTLGVYGFRHRRALTYLESYVPSSRDLPVPTIWEILSERGYRVAVVGMPPGYPPPPVNGVYVSDFLTPAGRRDFTHPPELRAEMEEKFGQYRFDVTFRSGERERLFAELMTMLEQRFAIGEWLYTRQPWDVFAIHEIGTDRLHHAYWKYFDTTHPDYVPGNRFEHTAREYYASLDEAIGRIVRHADERTYVLVVSDHGSMSMSGCFCVNDWLEQKSYLCLKRPPPKPGTPLEELDIDWRRTTVWGSGGYYARLFFNVRGREPNGIVRLDDAARLRRQLARDFSQIRDPSGQLLSVRILDPREIYATVRGDAPDLLVYLGDLRWRSAGTMGHPSLFLQENDTGPDDAVHSFDGVFLLYDPRHPGERTFHRLSIRDVAPTLLDLLDEPLPSHMQGRPVPGLRPTPPPVSVERHPDVTPGLKS
jgi:predicted AlkP superfamily phosphohydrolase/phosphomutase